MTTLPGLLRSRLSSSLSAFIAISRARRLIPSTSRKIALMRYAVDITTAEQEVALCSVCSTEVLRGGFERNLAIMTEQACMEFLRFNHVNFKQVVPLIGLPEGRIRTSYNWYATAATIDSCVVLARLARPVKWGGMEMLFGKFSPQLADIFIEALHHFIDKRGALLASPIPKKFFAGIGKRYTQIFYNKCMALDNVTSFIDGNVIGIARPDGVHSNQRTTYNGHKRKHVLKFQAITTPDGLCAHLFGLEVGRRHDMFP